MNVYEQNGYKSRNDYLAELADQAGENSWKVYEVADLLGPSEDFDGLVTALESEDII